MGYTNGAYQDHIAINDADSADQAKQQLLADVDDVTSITNCIDMKRVLSEDEKVDAIRIFKTIKQQQDGTSARCN